jgi:hypothetical protein
MISYIPLISSTTPMLFNAIQVMNTLTVNGLVTQNTNQLTHYIGYQINPLQVSNGTYWGYLLLAKAYTSDDVHDSEVLGTFTFSRGNGAEFNRTDIFSVHSKSAYETEYFVVHNLLANSTHFVSTVKITYNGIIYHAIKLSQNGGDPSNLVSFDGYATNAWLTIVQSNDPNLVLSSEIPFGNVGISSNNLGYIGINQPNPSQPLEVNGNAQIDGDIISLKHIISTGDSSNTQYTVNSNNQITSVTQTVNGIPITKTYTYNSKGYVTSYTIQIGSNAPVTYNVAYNAYGVITSIVQS